MSAHENESSRNQLAILDLPSEIREYYNTLRDRLLLSLNSDSEPPRLIAITSCYSGEGVSTVAANLAVTLSHQGVVLLVDANMDHPSVHEIFNKSITPGLAERLEGEEAIMSHAAQNLDILPAGKMNGSLPRMYESPQRLSRLLAAYKQDYRYCIFDTPAVNETSAAMRMASLVDGVILVVEAERTRWEAVRRVKEQLLQVNATLLGIVLNKRIFPIPSLLYRK
jgi:capsular exopolysaccharide synthesis family protein